MALLLAACVIGFLGFEQSVPAQDTTDLPIRVQGPSPVGVRNSVTEGWSSLQFIVENPNSTGRDARVAVFYPEKPGVQYARDIWVPARSAVTTSIDVGPAPSQSTDFVRQFETVLYDRTGGKNKVILPPGEQRVRTRGVIYRKREQTTAVLADIGLPEPGKPDPRVSDEILTLARLPRVGAFSEYVSIVHDGSIPVSSESLQTIDVFAVAGDRLSLDPPGLAALRKWVQEGGRLWVMLDQAKPDIVAAIMGDEFDVGIVDTVELTSVLLRGQSVGTLAETSQPFDQPVKFVRTIPGEADRVIATVDGWPAAFVRRSGRGKIIFTTLGQRGWSRPRVTRDGASPFPNFKDFPIPQNAVTFLAAELHPPVEDEPLPVKVFEPMLAEQIGYSIVNRTTVAIVMGAFVIVLTATVLAIRRSRSPTTLAMLLPVAAIVASVIFVALGNRTRQALPTTVALAGILDPTQGGEDSLFTGMYAYYQPDAGPALLGSSEGAVMLLDEEGLEGKTRIRLETDTDSWRWDGLAFPAGARLGYLRSTIKTGKIFATAKFGPKGIEGKLTTGNLTGLSDAVLTSKSRELLAIRFGPDGQFTSGLADALPSGQFLADSVLTDKQQQRQEIIRRIHTRTDAKFPYAPKHLEGQDFILAWVDAPVSSVSHEPGTVVSGNALVVIPVEFQKSPANSSVVIPRGLLSYKRLEDGKPIPMRMEASYAVDTRLRFQIPASVLPMQLTKATLHLHVRAPFRKLTVTGGNDAKAPTIFQTEAPSEPLRIEITDPAMLKLDADGGIFLNVAIGQVSAGSDTDTKWKIETMSLEVAGMTLAKP